MTTLFARIPEDRVGVLIGLGGRTVREIARRTSTKVEVDSEEGEGSRFTVRLPRQPATTVKDRSPNNAAAMTEA